MASQTISLVFLGESASAVRAINQVGAAADKVAKSSSGKFDQTTSKIGRAFQGLDRQLAGFGSPLTGVLGSVGKKFDDASGKAGGFGKTLSNIGKVEAVAAAAGIASLAVAIGKVGFDELKQGDKAAAQTAAALKSTGNAANVTADHIAGLAHKLQNLSGVDDNVIQGSENLLLTFTNIQNKVGAGNDIFDQATKAVLDMSVALGQDTSASAIQLGKALNDPIKGITALRRVGVSFTQEQTAQIKVLAQTGHALEAQKKILAELNKEFGGSAAAFGQTIEGRIERIKRGFEDFSATVIEDTVPALIKVGDAFVKVNDLTGGYAAKFGLALAAVPLAVFAYEKLSGILGKAAGAFTRLGQAATASTTATEGSAAAAAATGAGFAATATGIGLTLGAAVALALGIKTASDYAKDFFGDGNKLAGELKQQLLDTGKLSREQAAEFSDLLGVNAQAASTYSQALLAGKSSQEAFGASVGFTTSELERQNLAKFGDDAARYFASLSPAERATRQLALAQSQLTDDMQSGHASASQLARDHLAVSGAAKLNAHYQNEAAKAATEVTDAAGATVQSLDKLGKVGGAAVQHLADEIGLTTDQVDQLTSDLDGMNKASDKAFSAATDSVQKFGDQARVSFGDVVKFEEDNLHAAEKWSVELAFLADKGLNKGFLQKLADAGPKSIGLVQAIFDNVKNGSIATLNTIDQTAAKFDAGLKGSLDHAVVEAQTGFDGIARAATQLPTAIDAAAASLANYEKTNHSWRGENDLAKLSAAGVFDKLKDVASAAKLTAQEQAFLSGKTLTAAQAHNAQVTALRGLEDQFPQLRTLIEGFIGSLDRIPAKKHVEITVGFPPPPRKRIGTITEVVNGVPVSAPVMFEPAEKGGPVKDKGLYLVGEKGPEFFVPDQPGTIIPHDKTQKMLDEGVAPQQRAKGGPTYRAGLAYSTRASGGPVAPFGSTASPIHLTFHTTPPPAAQVAGPTPAQQALDQFVSSITSKLPDAQTAVGTFASSATSAMGDVKTATDAVTSATNDLTKATADAKVAQIEYNAALQVEHQANAQVQADNEALQRARGRHPEVVRLEAETVRVNKKVDADQADLFRLQEQHASGKAIAFAQARLDNDTKAQQADQAELDRRRTHAKDLTDIEKKRDTDIQTLQQKAADRTSAGVTLQGLRTQEALARGVQDTAKKDEAAAKAAAAKAADVTQFTAAIKAEANTIRLFEANEEKILGWHDVNLAKALATAGPDQASAVAQGFAADKGKADAAESQLIDLNAASKDYGKFAKALGIATPKAAGGPFGAGQLLLVGEKGPELARFPQAGTMIPNHAIGGGGSTTNVYVTLTVQSLDPRKAGPLVVEALQDVVRKNGPIRDIQFAA